MNRKRYSEIKFEKAKAIINELTKLLINVFIPANPKEKVISDNIHLHK